ncbi:MAG: UDP-glucose/GDP-mannose dehydrogenase family protein, partial [Actinomycetota bacterium]
RRLRITVVGAGHVGLVSAVSLATIGHRLRVLDVDAARIESLRRGETPFVEPYLPEFLRRTIARGELTFHTDAREATAGADIVFICVGTPNLPDGSVDMRGLIDATRAVATHAPAGTAIVSRSTAPVGTASYLRSLVVETRGDDNACVAVNPEFLAEGTAIRDFLFPDRIVIGAMTSKAVERVREAYEPIVARRLPTWLPAGLAGTAAAADEDVPVVVTDPPTAELTKYAANAFLAVRISFINEIATIAEEMGADVTRVAHAIGLDPRIGPHFLAAGVGWGGSCFPKDIVALQGMAQTRGVQARMLQAANDINTDQRRWVRRQLQRHLRTLVGRRVCLFGLAFKANTDDLRHAPALEIAAELAVEGVRVRAYDPAVTALPAHLADVVEIMDGPLAAAEGAEAIVVVTDWPEFRAIDLDALRAVVRLPLLLDGRNGLDRVRAEQAGFTYVGVGRPVASPVTLEESVAAAADF